MNTRKLICILLTFDDLRGKRFESGISSTNFVNIIIGSPKKLLKANFSELTDRQNCGRALLLYITEIKQESDPYEVII